MAVRTKKLALGSFTLQTGIATVIYTVPADRRTIIRSVTILKQGGAAVTVDVRINGTNFRKPTLQPEIADVFEVWQVLEAGDQYTLRQSSGAQISALVWMSGAELDLTP